MKITGGLSLMPVAMLLLFLPLNSLYAQSIHPQNLFDAGLNMGYLVGHDLKGTDHAGAPIWAGDAAAEWLGSWSSGLVNPITSQLEEPAIVHLDMQNTMRNMEGCEQEYFNLRLSIYKLGFHIGNALVETNYHCSSCLRLEMQKSAVEIRTIGQLLGSSQWQELANKMNTQSQELDIELDSALLLQQNEGQFGFLESQLHQMNRLLPDRLISCGEEKGDEEVKDEVVPQKEERVEKMVVKKEEEEETDAKEITIETKKSEVNKNQFFLTGGYTAAYVLGDEGPVSNKGSGFYFGLDVVSGRNLFLITGLDFYRNSAGQRFLIPSQGQLADTGQYIQGIRVHLGLGIHLINTKNLGISPFAKLHMFVGNSIDGEYSSIGQVEIADYPLDLNIGAYFSYKFITFHAAYEFGLRPIFLLSGTEMKYRIWNVGLGIRI